MSKLSRRRVLIAGISASLASLLGTGASRARKRGRSAAISTSGRKPAVVGSPNTHGAALAKALDVMESGGDTLDACVEGVTLIEDDPNVHSVGLGGRPNADGVVELDACCMHGPTHEAGSVASLRNIRNPAAVARKVLWETDHVMLVGEGALRFARMHGFEEQNLLTEDSRKAWLRWKASHSDRDDWLRPDEKRDVPPAGPEAPRVTGTTHVSACNAKGEVSGVTSTSGLAWKIPGRVGDSPIIGAGLYTHGKVGSAGSTGRGEAVIIAGGARTVVEEMGRGSHPQDACLAAVERVIEMNSRPRLMDESGKPSFNVVFYALDVRGRTGGAGIYPGSYARGDAQGVGKADLAHARER